MRGKNSSSVGENVCIVMLWNLYLLPLGKFETYNMTMIYRKIIILLWISFIRQISHRINIFINIGNKKLFFNTLVKKLKKIQVNLLKLHFEWNDCKFNSDRRVCSALFVTGTKRLKGRYIWTKNVHFPRFYIYNDLSYHLQWY